MQQRRQVLNAIDDARSRNPLQRDLLLVGSGINFIDVAGAELLVEQARLTRERGGDLFLCNLKPPVLDLLKRGGFLERLGADHVFATEEEALAAIGRAAQAARSEPLLRGRTQSMK
jgi:SulP family sulfate permease